MVDIEKLINALIIVDLQYSFLPGGALAVPRSNEITSVIMDLVASGDYQYIFLTQDWHPKKHGSFASTHEVEPFTMGELNRKPQMMWPDHCVQNTDGANIFKPLVEFLLHNNFFEWEVFQKGKDSKIDSYSGFYDNNRKSSTGLTRALIDCFVNNIDICGLATDYCVKFTALDAVKEGFKTRVLLPACRGVDKGLTEVSIIEMKNAGVEIVECLAFEE